MKELIFNFSQKKNQTITNDRKKISYFVQNKICLSRDKNRILLCHTKKKQKLCTRKSVSHISESFNLVLKEYADTKTAIMKMLMKKTKVIVECATTK